MLSAEDRKLIKNVTVSDAVTFNGASGFLRARNITFFVGTLGPFTRTVALVDYNAQKLDELYAQELEGLRAAGAL
jgi:methionine synthase I (cobalamin-dependent)